MKPTLKHRIAAVLVTFGLLGLAGATPVVAAGSLDGKTYTGMIGKTGETGDPDNFIFTDGTFRSTACDQYGYTAAPYNVMEEDGKTVFSSTTENSGGNAMAWKGTVNGDAVEGTVVMSPKDGKPQTFWFKGERKP